MKRWMVILAAAAVSSVFASSDWKPLFNGKDFTGWTFDTLDKAAMEEIWSVKDGVIVVNGKGKPNGVLRTVDSHSDYELEFEWRWPDSGGNSGCLIHCSEPRQINVWPQSIEVQLRSGDAGDFWLIGETIEVNPEQVAEGKDGKPGRKRFNLVDGAEKPLGEWNTMRVIAKGKSIEVYVNGLLVQKGWNASVSEGAISLQAERANIEFRNIRIRPVPAE